ncbi:MAG: methionyl-tRNA formyltransferase [Planctomycetaceae bacterium]|nr:methionyl-tRNA formyltransferase [Planctomycetaceae bacterium]
MISQPNYIVAGCKPWNSRVFEQLIRPLPGRWQFVSSPPQLTEELVAGVEPRYLFFLHWSWIVPAALVENRECVCFHMTDVPYGRGGSPLQNLIERGHRSTMLTALRMTEQLDAGPVYVKQPLSLEGGAEEIYLRATELSAKMIEEIVETQPEPQPQQGDPVVFVRRKPEQSEITSPESLFGLHDFIRMLDADGYPTAFFERDGFRYEFRRSALYDGRIQADVYITKTDEEESPWPL